MSKTKTRHSKYPEYLTITFPEIGTGSFFYYNGNICLKTGRDTYTAALPHRQEVVHYAIGEGMKISTKLNVCNVYFSYVKKDEYKDESENENQIPSKT